MQTYNLKKQQGVMLLEALISILIFSIGILALVGLQSAAVSLSSDAKYRSDASLLANGLIGAMWNDIASEVANSAPGAMFPLTEFDKFKTGGSAFYVWNSAVQASLPNASAVVTTSTVLVPTTAAANVLQTSTTTVAVVVTWQPPGASTTNAYRTSTQIAAQKTIR